MFWTKTVDCVCKRMHICAGSSGNKTYAFFFQLFNIIGVNVRLARHFLGDQLLPSEREGGKNTQYSKDRVKFLEPPVYVCVRVNDKC